MEEGGIVQAFALYFDAFFQSVVKVTPDLTYRVTPASRLAPETFRNHDRHGFNVYLQTAFAARQRWLLAGPDRRPLGFVRAPPGAFHTVCIFDGGGRATQGNRHKVARNIFIKGDTPVHVKTR
jgi:hypothetical protein